MRTLILTPALDDRDGEGVVASRIGLKADGPRFARDDDLLAHGARATSPRTASCIACWSTKRSSCPARRSGS